MSFDCNYWHSMDQQRGLQFQASCAQETTISGRRPVVFLLPGLQGSRLRVGDKRVWLSPMQIANGGIRCIGTDAVDVRSDGLLPSGYGALAQFLRQKYDVIEFHYDWRKSMVDQADLLNASVQRALDETAGSRQPIQFVSHSMGGLIARMLIARHRKTWDRMRARTDKPGLLMLGTPNEGSMSIVWSLIGKDRMVRLLGALDFRSTMAEILSEIGAMPGLLELLPSDADGRYFSPDVWNGLAGVAPQGWRAPKADALQAAWTARQALILRPQDATHMAYIAGRAPMTPISIEARRQSHGWTTRLIATKAGDGRVPWHTGRLAGVPTWYAEGVNHRSLPKQKTLFPAIDEVLAGGQTDELPQRPAIAEDESALFEVPTPRSALQLKGLAEKCRVMSRACYAVSLPGNA